MLVDLIRIENQAGTSQRTGNDYSMSSVFVAIALSTGQKLQRTTSFTRKKVGYNIGKYQIADELYDELALQFETGNLTVQLELESDFNSEGEPQTRVIGFTEVDSADVTL